MKKYINAISFVMMAVFSLSIVSCGGDEEDNVITQSNEKVSVEYAGAKTEYYQVTQATYTYLYQRVEGTTKIDSNDGTTFNVTFSDGDGYYTYWQFQTRDDIKKGANLTTNCVFFNNDPRATDETEGNAIVKSVSKDKITLSFKSFSFKRYISYDSNKKQKITINGEITFTFDE